jgi:transcriptional regulator with XRE-family HTH domain
MADAEQKSPNGVDWARWMRGLGEQVLRAREFVGLSQEQLARVAGVSQGAVSRLENGKGLATPLLVVTKICGALRTALSHVDPAILSPEARRIVETGMRLPDGGGSFLESGPAHDSAVEELLHLYYGLSERQRPQLLAVLRAMAAALSGEAARRAAERSG